MTTLLGSWDCDSTLLTVCAAAREMGHTDVADRLAAQVIARDVTRTWSVSDDSCADYTSTEADSLAEALAWAVDDCRDSGAYDATEGTVYVRVSVCCEATGEEGSETVTIAQDEPDCMAGESHDWASPQSIVGEFAGVRGNGGGVTISECCLRCGCRRHTDTWAQDPSTGEQGLTSVTYDEGHYSDELSRRRSDLVTDALSDHTVEDSGADWVIGCDDAESAAAIEIAVRAAVGGACDVSTWGDRVEIAWRDGATARRSEVRS